MNQYMNLSATGAVASTPKPKALRSKTVAVRRLDAGTTEQMWRLFEAFYTDSDRATFASDLQAKERVILLFDRHEGSLRGFSTLQSYTVTVQGRRVRIVYSGDTIIDPAYWGRTALQWAFLRNGLWQKLVHPHLPVYWFLISKGYKTYLLLSRNFPEHWPRHERPTPPWQQALLDRLARDKFGVNYQADRGVLVFEQRQGRLRDRVAPIDAEALRRRDIRFFTKRNPGHVHGEELCCIGRIGIGLAGEYLTKIVRRHVSAMWGRR